LTNWAREERERERERESCEGVLTRKMRVIVTFILLAWNMRGPSSIIIIEI
jgi:hypothetical protein